MMVEGDEGEDSDCRCHSYEEIACPDAGVSDALDDEHIEEITNFCQGVVDGTEAECPYLCYQPIEVLHLHYLECPSRAVHDTYALVDATGLCHGGSTDVPMDMKTEEMCPAVELHSPEDHDHGDGHDHGDDHDHGDGHSHSHDDEGTELAVEDSAPDDENAAPRAVFGLIYTAGFFLSLVFSMA